MTGRITSRPADQHYCYAGWRIETDEEAATREAQAAVREAQGDPVYFNLPPGYRRLIEDRPWAAEGTIWTCDDCGTRWRATYPYVNVFAPTWVRCVLPLSTPRWLKTLKGLIRRG